jgi:hypothetical protein
MAELILAREGIKADISAFDSGIESAMQQLLALPATAAGRQARKKISATRNKLLTEIDHIKRIRQYAMDSLAEFAEG